ncbi:MAG: WYL domain-containing protein [Muribaculaceae bacterium]|nr:WYL domain-containing protein [Muribaculaceae bacterium]
MRSSEIFREYIWLVRTIWQAGRITLEEISNRWENCSLSDGKSLSRSTFNRHREAIERIFDLQIKCDRHSGNVYYIANADTIGSDNIANWLASSLTVSNLISESREIQNRIMLEPVPYGGETLQILIDAMKINHIVEMEYRSYGKPAKQYTLEPYCIRLFRQRWYLLGHFDNKFRIFSFDRITKINITTQKFILKDSFDCGQYFSDFFGVMTDLRIKPQKIILRAHGQERYYLQDLPLHHSQKIISETDKTVDFELYIRPTTDFMATIFSRAGWVEIIYPMELKEQLLDWAKKMMTRISGDSSTLPQWE